MAGTVINLGYLSNSTSPIYDQDYQGGDRGEGGTGYTITGTGFGTKGASTPIFEDFEGETVGAAGNIINDVQVSNADGATIISTGALSGTRSLQNDFGAAGTQTSFPKVHVDLTGTSTKLYCSAHIKVSGDYGNVWKMSRAGPGAVYSGNPSCHMEYTGTQGGNAFGRGSSTVYTPGITSWWSAHSTSGTDGTDGYIADVDQFYEYEMYTGTLNNSDASFFERVSGVETTTFVNRPFLTTANSGLVPTWMMTPMNGNDQAETSIMIMDSVYIDESRARVVMTDNATYASSTKWAIQPILTYSDTTVTATAKRQYFDIGDTAYLHLFDDDGVLVDSGSSFTVAGDS